jgi:hypothetical protein
MSYEVNFDGLTQNLNSIILSEEGKMLQQIAKPGIIKNVKVSENKSLRLFLKDQKYFVELIANGYSVIYVAGKALQEAEKCYMELLQKVREGESMLEPY